MAEQTFTVALEELVKLVDDRQTPGAHIDTAIRLLNAETRDRQPQWVMKDGLRFAHVTADEYSDIKLNLIMGLLNWLKAGTGDGDGDGGNRVM